MAIETYQRRSQVELGLTDEEWTALAVYLDDLQTALKQAEIDAASTGVSSIEEDPPQIENGQFFPGGWIGQYPGGVRVIASRFSQAEEKQLLAETAAWADLIGPTTFTAALPVSSEILIDSRAQLAGYSTSLIDLTEVLRSGRLPTSVTREQTRGTAPDGRPLLQETMRTQSRGTRTVVTESMSFSFATPANHLLVRFHADIGAQLRALTEMYETYAIAFREQLRYHESFLAETIPQRLLESAVTIDFTDPQKLAEIRASAKESMAEVVDLWEAFQQDQRLELQLHNQLNTAVKPLSTVYELWCLGIILEELADLTGEQPDTQELVGTYAFGDHVTLAYDRSLQKHSNYLTPAFGVNSGRPDFALLVDNAVVWVGDAKLKSWRTLGLPDYQRFLTYLLDLLAPEQTGSILYAETERATQHQAVGNFTVQHVPLRPGKSDHARQWLRATLGEQLPEMYVKAVD